MDLDTAANELYALSPDDFIERRQQLVAEARQAKDRELANQIGKLRRPTRTAWLINLLARHEPEPLNALFELGAALQDAQQRMAGDELRQLSAERRKAVDALAQRAVELGREHGYNAPDGAVQEVGQTLQSALGDREIADVLRAGQLTQAVTYGGFGPTDLASALGASLPTKTPSEPKEKLAPAEPAAATRSEAASPSRKGCEGSPGAGNRRPRSCGVSGGGGGGSHATCGRAGRPGRVVAQPASPGRGRRARGS